MNNKLIIKQYAHFVTAVYTCIIPIIHNEDLSILSSLYTHFRFRI